MTNIFVGVDLCSKVAGKETGIMPKRFQMCFNSKPQTFRFTRLQDSDVHIPGLLLKCVLEW